jgi:hypothetical protein
MRFTQQHLPFLQGIPAWLVGVGFRPEHVDLGVIDRQAGVRQ